ncbi:hypothetical protein [Galactobacter sp.]|nr:hypothetical protein [Galactobacter sp.]
MPQAIALIATMACCLEAFTPPAALAALAAPGLSRSPRTRTRTRTRRSP